MYSIAVDLPVSGITIYNDVQENGILSISGLRRAITPFLYTIENQRITISMKNVNGYWWNLLKSSDRYITNRLLQVYSNDSLIGTFRIYDFDPTDNTTFKIIADTYRDIDQSLSIPLTSTQYPNIPEQNRDRKANIIAGTLTDAGWLNLGECTAPRVDTNLFHAAAHPLYSIDQVYDKDGNAITYTVAAGPDNHALIQATSTEMELYFNCRGMMDDYGSLITNPAYQVEKILQLFTDLTLSGVEEAAAYYTRKKYTDNAILINSETRKGFLQKFSGNYNTYFFTDASGALKMKVHDSETQEIALAFQSDTITISPSYDPKNLLKAVSRQYYYHYRKNLFLYSPLETLNWLKWQTGAVDTLSLYYHRTNANSLSIVSNYLFYHSQPQETVVFQTFPGGLDLGDLFSIRYYGSGLHQDETREYLCIKIESPNNNSNTVNITGLDTFAVNSGKIILYSRSDPRALLLTSRESENAPHLF